ncbi:uncharacterized protein LOC113151954 isoform X2 [Anabas testudineus]|uniref:uncharacterized protein LOC113151954 isoform X2 n=1 Tax=Anabas testudineus TaxID=64144 RepID=UPI000E456772|nr:uncharacterized protein LOC113151954 isoform X2 [Anabas testudineus]
MWTWILICLNIVTKVYGYASTPFPQACGSMLPIHESSSTGVIYNPQNTESPFEIYYNHGKEGEPITVFLSSKTDKTFKGFMLEAREQDRVDEGTPVGKFILLDPDKTKLLTCEGFSAVMQTTNQRKSIIKVNWTAEGEQLDITFRATFVEDFAIFWERVDVNVTQPITTPSTTASTTDASTTELSTTDLSLTTSATEPSMTSLSPITNITSSLPSTIPEHANKLKAAGIAVVSYDSLIVVLNMQLSIMFTTFSISPFSPRLKGLKISCSVLCAAVEISTLVLFCVGDLNKVVPIALVIVTIVINFIELVMVCLPIGPSHELKDICNLAVKICSVIHVIFTIAVMFVGVLEIEESRNSDKNFWPLKVMAAYTAWISLFVICVFILSTNVQTKLGRNKTGSSTESWKQQRKKLGAAEVIVWAVSVIFVVGTMAFTVAIICGLFLGV